MKKVGLAVFLIFIFLLVIGCSTNEANFSKNGAKAKVTQLVNERIGNDYGPKAAKTVKMHFSKVEEGVSEGRMFVNGDFDYKLDGWKENGIDQVRYVNTKFHFELQHNGTEWTVHNNMFFDEERRDKK